VKNAKTLYWIVTSLMAAFMLRSSVPDVVGDSPSGWMPAVIGLVLIGGSYLSYRRQLIPQDEHGRAHSASPGDTNNVMSASVEDGINPRTVGIR
jgi:hypothetical protein